MAQMRAYSVLQKWSKIAKMTPNDLLTSKMTSKRLFYFPKIHYFILFRAKNEFHDNIANYII